jgi:hypothetical protein
VNRRNSIRGIAITTGTVVAAAAMTAGLNVTGALAETVASDNEAHPAKTTAVATAPSDWSLVQTKHRVQRYKAHKMSVHARHIRKERAAKAAATARAAREAASRSTTRTYSGDPRGIARSMMASRYSWGGDQFSCLNSLWDRESGWNVHAANPSGAYGIPQALPGSKMSTAGGDWQNNPATQIAWGLSYVKSRYGTPCGAWSAFQSKGWY